MHHFLNCLQPIKFMLDFNGRWSHYRSHLLLDLRLKANKNFVTILLTICMRCEAFYSAGGVVWAVERDESESDGWIKIAEKRRLKCCGACSKCTCTKRRNPRDFVYRKTEKALDMCSTTGCTCWTNWRGRTGTHALYGKARIIALRCSWKQNYSIYLFVNTFFR